MPSSIDARSTHALDRLGRRNLTTTAANVRGRVAGFSDLDPDDRRQHAFLWSAAPATQNLGTSTGAVSPLAEDIDSTDEIAGRIIAGGPDDPGHRAPFCWCRCGGFVDLGPVADHFGNAWEINDAGQSRRGHMGHNVLFRWPAPTGVVAHCRRAEIPSSTSP